MKHYHYSIIFFFTLLLLNSCSGISLTHEEALEILKKDYEEYCESDVRSYTSHYNSKAPKPLLEKFKELEKNNIVVVKHEQQYSRGRPSFIEYYWKPTEETINRYKNKSDKRYKITEAVVNEVIAISINEEQKTALVKFTYNMVPTPFIEIQYGKCNISTNVEKEVSFILYDTGWQIKN